MDYSTNSTRDHNFLYLDFLSWLYDAEFMKDNCIIQFFSIEMHFIELHMGDWVSEGVRMTPSSL